MSSKPAVVDRVTPEERERYFQRAQVPAFVIAVVLSIVTGTWAHWFWSGIGFVFLATAAMVYGAQWTTILLVGARREAKPADAVEPPAE